MNVAIHKTSKELPASKAWSIIGAGVHVMMAEDPRYIDRQGHVVQQHGDRILVQWFDWIVGEGIWATWHSLDEVAAAKWRFFKSVEDMNDYYMVNRTRLIKRVQP